MKAEPATEAAVPVVCDCCEAPFLLERRFVRAGQVFGLIICTQCTEDNLAASVNTGGTLELVGSGGGRS